MMPKPPRHQPPISEPEPAGTPAPPEEELESATPGEDEPPADPYDDLWDPDMDTRPEKIKRTKARPRGRPSPRGRRKEEA